MAGLSTMCDCGFEFRGKAGQDLCPRCQRIDDEQHANDPAPYVDTSPWPWSKSAMQELLGIVGNVDE